MAKFPNQKRCPAVVWASRDRSYLGMNIIVARKLHERRFRASPVMTTGELVNLIGSDGIQEALLNRWLVPDTDTGFLTLNTGGGKLRELEEACRCRCGKLDCACEAAIEDKQVFTMPMRENFAGFGLTSPGGAGGAAPAMMPRPQAPSTPTAPQAPVDKDAPQIGDDAMVSEDGKAYTGKVASIGQDGRFRISFGSEKPNMHRDYSPNELKLLNKAAPNA